MDLGKHIFVTILTKIDVGKAWIAKQLSPF